jgi:hypothetical protein
MKKVIIILGLVVLIIGFGCQTPPEYSKIPYIEFRQAIVYHQKNQDSVWINIYFRDGDGDLGNPTNSTSKNYFINMYKKTGSQFAKYSFPDTSFNLNGSFPSLNPDNKIMPIEGTLSYEFIVPKFFPPKTLVYFQISIEDQAGHISNQVQTDIDTLQ